MTSPKPRREKGLILAWMVVAPGGYPFNFLVFDKKREVDEYLATWFKGIALRDRPIYRRVTTKPAPALRGKRVGGGR